MWGMIHRTAVNGLAYERQGDGVPVVFLHGLTFDRTTWRPIIERLGEDVCSIAFDLPGHGETGGRPCTMREAAAMVHAALGSIKIDEPVIVGHSISSGIASMYAASYPVRGLVNVDGTVDIRQTATLVQRLEPALRSDRFTAAFEPFQTSMGFEHLPELLRAQILESQDVRQAVVLGYWEQLLRTDPCDLQAEIELEMGRIDMPCLNVFGHALSDHERRSLREHVSDVWIEEWPDRGHHVHLAEADRFAARLRSFIDQCWRDGERPLSGRENVITRMRMDELVDEHLRAEIAGDLQTIADGFTADAEHDVAGRPGPPLRGGEQIRAFYAGLLAELEITRFERLHRWYGNDHLADESILHAIARGRPFGLEGHGRAVHVRILHVFDFARDHIRRESAWLDVSALQQQLAR